MVPLLGVLARHVERVRAPLLAGPGDAEGRRGLGIESVEERDELLVRARDELDEHARAEPFGRDHPLGVEPLDERDHVLERAHVGRLQELSIAVDRQTPQRSVEQMGHEILHVA